MIRIQEKKLKNFCRYRGTRQL